MKTALCSTLIAVLLVVAIALGCVARYQSGRARFWREEYTAGEDNCAAWKKRLEETIESRTEWADSLKAKLHETVRKLGQSESTVRELAQADSQKAVRIAQLESELDQSIQIALKLDREKQAACRAREVCEREKREQCAEIEKLHHGLRHCEQALQNARRPVYLCPPDKCKEREKKREEKRQKKLEKRSRT